MLLKGNGAGLGIAFLRQSAASFQQRLMPQMHPVKKSQSEYFVHISIPLSF
jgi:hypothetical protein